MRNTQRHFLPTLLAASFVCLGSCSHPPTEEEPVQVTEVRREATELDRLRERAEAVAGDSAIEDRIAESSATQRVIAETPVVEEPIIEYFEASLTEEPEEPVIEDFVVEEEPAPEIQPGVKVMGPWVAGDQIESGRPNVKPIEILQVHANGSGDVCGTGKRATLRYVAMSADGSVLDPGTRPFTFRVGSGQAISGWDVVVAKMRIGDSFTLMLPEELAYGPSKGDLKFDMELLSFQ